MKKKLAVMGLVSIMTMSMVACGKDEKTSSNEPTSVITTDGSSEELSTEEDTTEKKADNTDELTDEYLLSLPETPVEEFWYEEIEGGILIKSCLGRSGSDKIIVIPNQIDGKDVIEIDREAFVRANLKAVVLNKNLKVVGGGSFLDATIEKVLLQEGVETIGGEAFFLSDINEINIPSTVKRIWTNAFGSTDIAEVTIPKSVEEITVAAFSGCDKLETITFEGCPNVEFGTFTLCSNIKKVICLDGNRGFHKDEFYEITGEPKDVTFVAPAGSEVEQYAKDNGFKFEVLN